MSILHPPSSEQTLILERLARGHNVFVNAVAGSGKTTSNLHVAKRFPDLRILLLTYNARLKKETRERVVSEGITNMEVHTFHSFCYKRYSPLAFDDKEIERIVNEDMKCKSNFSFNIVIIDEAQDCTHIYFRMVCKMLRDNIALKPTSKVQMIVMGDKRQSIYGFKGADHRYLTHINSITEPLIHNRIISDEWSKLELSETYRVPSCIARFVNKGCLKENVLRSMRKTGTRPVLIECDMYKEAPSIILDTIADLLLNKNYKPSDIFILAPSVKSGRGSNKSPLAVLENRLKTRLKWVPVHVPSSDEEVTDEKVLEGKLSITTFHQSKGLERKVVFVWNFDSVHDKYFRKNEEIANFSNAMYVALTRTKDLLYVLKSVKENDMASLVPDYRNYMTVINSSSNTTMKPKTSSSSSFSILKSDDDNDSKSLQRYVTRLCSRLTHNDEKYIMTLLKTEEVSPPSGTLRDSIKIENRTSKAAHGSVESVATVNGIAVTLGAMNMLMGDTTSTTSMYTQIILANDKKSKNNSSKHELFKVLPTSRLKKVFCSGETDCASRYLEMAVLWDVYENQYISKACQLNRFNWINNNTFNILRKRIVNRISKGILEKDKDCIMFEYPVSTACSMERNNMEYHVITSGFVDVYDMKNNVVYEIKCVSEVTTAHLTQLALYAYIMETNSIAETGALTTNTYLLYNARDDGCTRVYASYDDLKKIHDYLYFSRDVPCVSDEEFVHMNQEACVKSIGLRS